MNYSDEQLIRAAIQMYSAGPAIEGRIQPATAHSWVDNNSVVLMNINRELRRYPVRQVEDFLKKKEKA